MKNPSTVQAAANKIGAELAAIGPKVDLGPGRRYSYGPVVKSMIGAHETGVKVGFKIRNTCTEDIIIEMRPDNHIVKTAGGVFSDASVDAEFGDGDIFIEDASTNKKVTVTQVGSGNGIPQFLRYINLNNIQMTAWDMKSRFIADGEAATGNYDNVIKALHVSPFEKTKESVFTLSDLQGQMTFNQQAARANFLKEKFNALLSPEHSIVFQVNAGTELVITAYIGAQDSAAQRFYRDLNMANDSLMALRASEFSAQK